MKLNFMVFIFLFSSISLLGNDREIFSTFTKQSEIIFNEERVPYDITCLEKDKFIGSKYEDIIKFDSNGNILKTSGGKGRGPGEFEKLTWIKAIDDTLYCYDFMLKRISIFDKSLHFINSFNIDGSKVIDVIKKNNTLYILGVFFDYNADFDSYLLEKYDKNLYGKYEKSGRIIKIDTDILKKYKSKYFFNSDQAAFCKYGGDIYIVDSFLPYVIRYNLKNKNITKVKFNFKGYINPLKVKYQKIKKSKFLKKNKLQYISESYLTFSPIKIIHDKFKDVFIIQYYIPFQVQQANHFKNNYKIVIFDKDFNAIKVVNTNERIIGICEQNKGNLYFFTKDKSMYKFDEEDNEDNENKKEKIEIMKLK